MCLFAWNSFCCTIKICILMRKKSLTSTQVQENLTKIFELIAVVLVAGCLVTVCIWLF